MIKEISKILVLSFLALLAIGVQPVFADVSCSPVYGGGTTCNGPAPVSINKTVRDPKTGSLVDNLGVSDTHFRVGEFVQFNLAVKNNGSDTLSTVTVTDTLPLNLEFISGPGNFNANNRQVTFTLNQLNPDETRNFTILTKVQNTIPGGVTCEVNNSLVVGPNGQSNQDNAGFCLESTVPGPVTTPKAGPEEIMYVGFGAMSLLGVYLKRKGY